MGFASWLAATDAAIFALVCWRVTLQGWNDHPPNLGTVAMAFTCLDRAGLGEWAEWGAAAGGLDALAEVLRQPNKT